MVDMMASSMSSGASSSPAEEELELGLGLGLGLGLPDGRSSADKHRQGRIRTSQNLPSLFLPSSSGYSSASSASSSSNASNFCATLSRNCKRADEPAAGQVVGWPPVGNYRMNSMAGHSKSTADKSGSKNDAIMEEAPKNQMRKSPFVKVYMDGMPIGRKIDLCAQGSYETLAQALEEMFFSSSYSIDANNCSRRRFLRESQEFMLTYEDKDGDWMLVGDVPWGMFLTSVRRLKIMRAGETKLT